MDIKSVILSGIHRKSKTAENVIWYYKFLKSLSRKELKQHCKKIQSKRELYEDNAPDLEGGEG